MVERKQAVLNPCKCFRGSGEDFIQKQFQLDLNKHEPDSSSFLDPDMVGRVIIPRAQKFCWFKEKQKKETPLQGPVDVSPCCGH